MRGSRAVALLVATMVAGVAAAAGPRSPYDIAFDDAMARYHLPGLAVGVIEDGRVVWTRTAGETVAGSGKPVTSRTLFKIASNSKAMTTALLARLVAAGKLRWDDPVTRHLPQFRMHDDWVTRNIEVQDLLVHNSGLREGAGDLMLWPEPNAFTRADILAGLAWLVPQHSFRSRYAYDNLLYVVAGEVAAAAGGAPYEDLVRREVFEPLGLARCRVGSWRSAEVDDVAQPHMRKDGRNVVINADAAIVPAITSAAAGGIRCSLGDMLAWARNWLAPDARQLAWLSAERRRELWTAHTPMPISGRRRDWDRTHAYAYGLGWRLADVDGTWTVSHTGTLSGMYSLLMLLPDRHAGFVVLINGDGDAARTMLGEVLLKHFTAPAERATIAGYAARVAAEPVTRGQAAPDVSVREPVAVDELRTRLGIWRDPWFGEAALCEEAGRVRFRAAKSPLLSGIVMRSLGRTLVAWDDVRVDAEAWIDLPADADEGMLKLAKVDPRADFSFDFEDLAFRRVRDCD
ncbi:serine hydrolase domain-containing protein [Dokdonella fugitiva]|jgi:CubicO group peptidase (beta-lactamase class C family)|uniref:CubicO group peptidase (Beta-lactamase class C family) n=1 Tax=Dokdonella fugitiva TaxID=328517 RepID=A0A4R2HYG2_9GAMM|nr:serine hydrolase domain-containing protein [Dokdonella fugitiva]TCO36552.1 CubicO group peptidase (beta-lactamase class C family) [Dokdonella fugitiva]